MFVSAKRQRRRRADATIGPMSFRVLTHALHALSTNLVALRAPGHHRLRSRTAGLVIGAALVAPIGVGNLAAAGAAPVTAVGSSSGAASGSTTTVAAATTATAASWTAPSFVRSMAARGNAGIYAWGIAYNSVTDEVIVGDYMNYQLRRYSRDGTLLGSFYRPASQRRGHPESVAVDQRDGSIYTSDRSRDDKGYIAKFDKTGAFLWELNIAASYHAWITIDAEGFLYVSDSHVWHDATNPPQVRKYAVDDAAHTVTEVAHWGTYGTGPGQIQQITGIAVDAAGRVYTADTLNRTVHVWAPDGDWLRDIGTGGNGVGQFAGDLRGVTVNDATSTLYVVDAEGGQVERFDLTTGDPIGAFGSSGTGTGQFGDGGRQLVLDRTGNVWVSDFGNTRFHEFSPTGTLVGTFPQPAQNAPAGALSLPRDVAIDPANGQVLVVEQNNHRIQRFDTDGSPLGAWGRRSTDRPLGFNYPRGIAVEPATVERATERIWVANTNQDSIRVLNSDLTLAFEVGGEFGTDPGQFKNPMDIEFYQGKAYVSDYAGQKMKVLDATNGSELWSIDKAHSGVAVDPDTGDIYLSSWQTDVIWHYKSDGTPGIPAKFASRGTGAGQFTNGWDIDVVRGVVYSTDSEQNKVVAYTTAGVYLGQWGTAGSKPGQFNNPSGITHDAAGRLYVADGGNDRVQVFDPATTLAADAIVPLVAITSPAAEATVPAPVTLTGSVTDNNGVGTVEVAVQNRVTKQWWDGRIATWSAIKQWTTAGLKGSATRSLEWWFPFIGAESASQYYLQVRATDASGNVTTVIPNRRFNTVGTAPTDTQAPLSSITSPTLNAVLPSGVVQVAGTATDDQRVATEEVAIQDRTTKLWWNAGTARWNSSQQWSPATLAQSGSTSTTWSLAFDEARSAGSGAYYVLARAKDGAGNVQAVKPNTRFTTTR